MTNSKPKRDTLICCSHTWTDNNAIHVSPSKPKLANQVSKVFGMRLIISLCFHVIIIPTKKKYKRGYNISVIE